jgi:hypothetical protein
MSASVTGPAAAAALTTAIGQSLGWLTIAGLVVSGIGVSLTTRTPAPAAGHGDENRGATRDPRRRVTASEVGASR